MLESKDQKLKYAVNAYAPGDLTETERAECIAVIKRGNAVDPVSAAAELPLARVLAVARKGNRIVGVGVIKRIRNNYASGIALKSGASFPSDTPELGYVAVDSGHRGNRLSHRIVAELISMHVGPLFATTSCERMKTTLGKAGFVQKGEEWRGQKAQLSLWTRE